jgi:hypothetical protein
MNKIVFILLLSFSLSSYARTLECSKLTATSEQVYQGLSDIAHLIDQRDHDLNLDREVSDFVDYFEKISIKLYTTQLYKVVNPALREQKENSIYASYITVLCSALNKIPNFTGDVFRVVNLPQDIIDLYQPGMVITEKAFLSTSASLDGIAIFQEYTNRKFNTHFFIKSKNGKDISAYSIWPEEKEVLFRAGSKFKVTKVYRRWFSKITKIWLEEI